jgi:glycine betaine/proline transport system permease protein
VTATAAPAPAPAPGLPVTTGTGLNWRRVTPILLAGAAFAAVVLILGDPFPSWWDFRVAPAVDSAKAWIIENRSDHWFFSGVLQPITDLLEALVRWTEDLLGLLGWPGIFAATAFLAYRAAGWRIALVSVGCLLAIGVLGVWEEAVQTMALMLVAVAISLLIGVPLGILAGLHPKVDGALRGFLDAAQTMPAYCYLLFTVLLFDIGAPAAVIATVIFALAPAVRLTAHGIRGVPSGLIEVGAANGATDRQVLGKIQWPLARPAILLGVNQVIMMAFGVVVIAALVGSPGLGQSVLNGLEKIDVGLALDAGLAIVLVAVILDRISSGRSLTERRAHARRDPAVKRRELLIGTAIIAAAVIAAWLAKADQFPEGWTFSLREPVNDVVGWLQENVRTGVPVIGGTSSISDFLVVRMLEPLRQLLADTPWWIITAAVGALAWCTAGRKVALISVGCLLAIGGLRFWPEAMDTLSQVIVAVGLAVVIAVPIGILAGRSDMVDRALRPLLDAAQVLPAFVYLIPVIALFNVGRVPGLVASVIYAVPVGIRLTSLGIRQVPAETVEAAVAYGATPRQVLWKVQVPLAVPSIMLGVNQVIMMSLSMVIVAGLVGSGALGLAAVKGLTKSQYELGTGLAAGICIVLLAVVLDRITQAWGRPRRSASAVR